MNKNEVCKALTRWHDLITQDISLSDIVFLYGKLIIEELQEVQVALTAPQIIKECTDVIVVCEPVIRCGLPRQRDFAENMTMTMKSMICNHGVSWVAALDKVNRSNFSKLILDCEVDEAMDYFESKGIEVEIMPLGEGQMGCYSAKNQTVNGKFYTKGKLLKSHQYAAIDESKEWWK